MHAVIKPVIICARQEKYEDNEMTLQMHGNLTVVMRITSGAKKKKRKAEAYQIILQ